MFKSLDLEPAYRALRAAGLGLLFGGLLCVIVLLGGCNTVGVHINPPPPVPQYPCGMECKLAIHRTHHKGLYIGFSKGW